jgi:hypothetical protein
MSNFHFDLSLKLSQGEVHDFSGEVQKFSGEVPNDLRGGAKIIRGGAKQSQGRCAPPLKIRPWLQLLEKYKQNFNGIFQAVVSLYQFVASKYTFHLGFFGGGGHMF